MGDGQGNSNRSNTGTVPKIKYSNNAMSRDQVRGTRMSNNLSPSWHRSVAADGPNLLQYHNGRRNSHRCRYLPMDVALDNGELPNGVCYNHTNGITPASSSSNSRRNSVSSSLKCDNVTKYPDRKQIEDKLSQIREYLEVTSSLMTSIRNSDEQIFDIEEKTTLLQTRNDLLDSEIKLRNLLEEIDKSERAEAQAIQNLTNMDNYSESDCDYPKRTESDLESIDNELAAERDRQLSILKPGHKSENRVVDPRRIPQNAPDNQKLEKNMSLKEFDTAIKELEERAKQLKRNKPANPAFNADKFVSEMQHLQSQIVTMHDANNEREELIQVLDNRDTELRVQQAELKKKLLELQTKKEQVDQLVIQLQMIDDENQQPGDIGNQVRNIVTMKDQLKKLKGMLAVVNSTTEHTSAADVQAAANEICLTAENLQNEIAKPSHKRNDSFVENCLDNNHVSNQKQLNKSQRNQEPKPRTTSINEKIALQSELEAKKRELEEIMGRHKAATSNLNHDVQGNPVNDMSWKPPIFCRDPRGCQDRLSSDGDEADYSEVQDEDNIVFPYRAQRVQDNRANSEIPNEIYQSLSSQTSERNLRAASVTAESHQQEKLQKQLELIKRVCDSMLDQMPNQPNIQQVHNNITPSSMYSEQQQQQRVSCPPSPFRPNQIAVPPEPVWYPTAGHEMGNNSYQNWLATNSLQTQSFMLNTLNQCCQMLWLQQKELAQLRTTMNMLQERLDLNGYQPQSNIPTPPINNNNQLRVPVPPKTNHHHVSAACSMPNLNQYNTVPSSGNDLTYANASNVPNSALLESCLNNANHQHNLLHPNHLAQPIPPQLWNGQALNNQVAPGNRANNYWDNFRSYSRQNQLSSKNSESSVHNATAHSLDRFHVERVNPFPIMTTSKTNSENSSTNSRENTPRKRSVKVLEPKLPSDHHGPPPDVLNVNQNVRKCSFDRSEHSFSIEDLELDLNRILNRPDEAANLYTQERATNQGVKKKNQLTDDLRENVYTEVASLISANEARPHFLIQLFKELQKIESDSLRLKILQSVQNILTQTVHGGSINNNNVNFRESRESDSTLSESSEQTSVWSRPVNQIPSEEAFNIFLDLDEPLLPSPQRELHSMLESTEDEIISSQFLSNIKQSFLDSELLRDSPKDSMILKHFSNILNDVLEQYRGKKVADVKLHLVQSMSDLLQGELFIQLLQDNMTVQEPSSVFDTCNGHPPLQNDNIQNEDLAEADQSRLDDSELDEEGAVGGIVEAPEESQILLQVHSEDIQFPINGEGLDQVPIRLPTNIKSGRNTPNSDLLSSHRDAEPY